jgi:hypothetical protein
MGLGEKHWATAGRRANGQFRGDYGRNFCLPEASSLFQTAGRVGDRARRQMGEWANKNGAKQGAGDPGERL